MLADRLHVSGRTVRRDVDRLRELGYPIAALMGPDGGYRLEAGTELPPLLFDDDQAVAPSVALQLDMAVLIALNAAVRDAETLRFDYPAPDGAPAADAPPRRAQPHHLVVRGGRWYLVAWDLDREDWRTFRADRLVLRSPNGPRFSPREVPGDDVVAFIAGRFRGATAGTDWPCRGEVVLRAPLEDVTPYAGDGLVERLDDRRCRLVLGSRSWMALAATVARFDADIESAEPAELRAAFRVLGARAENVGGRTDPAASLRRPDA